MLNPFIIKKYTAVIMSAFVPTILFYVGIIYYKLWIALLLFGAGIGLSLVLALMFLSNPFSKLLEGKGILAMDMNSTGVLNLFIVNVTHQRNENPKLTGKINGRNIIDIFDRKAVFNLAAPRNVGTAIVADEKVVSTDETKMYMNIKVTEEEYNKGRFSMIQYPVIIYNSQMGSILTKDFFSNNEKEAFAEHTILYLTKVTEDLTTATRDFGRYVVETLKPTNNDWLKSKWTWIIIGIVLVVLAAIFAPSIIGAIKGSVGGATSSVTDALASGKTVTAAGIVPVP